MVVHCLRFKCIRNDFTLYFVQKSLQIYRMLSVTPGRGRGGLWSAQNRKVSFLAPYQISSRLVQPSHHTAIPLPSNDTSGIILIDRKLEELSFNLEIN